MYCNSSRTILEEKESTTSVFLWWKLILLRFLCCQLFGIPFYGNGIPFYGNGGLGGQSLLSSAQGIGLLSSHINHTTGYSMPCKIFK